MAMAVGRTRAAFPCLDLTAASTSISPARRSPIRFQFVDFDLDVHDGPVELKMLYVPFDTFTPIVDEQRYRCLARRSLYRYEAVDRSFSADLPVDSDGLVTDYPGLFERVAIAS